MYMMCSKASGKGGGDSGGCGGAGGDGCGGRLLVVTSW